jgi:L-asparaginase II
MARSFASLGSLEGADRIFAAMRAHPELVGGEGSLDTDLMRRQTGWAAKGGAEGLLCAVGPDGTGYAIKSEDGSQRPLRPALARFLELDLGSVPVVSSRREVVGEVVVE